MINLRATLEGQILINSKEQLDKFTKFIEGIFPESFFPSNSIDLTSDFESDDDHENVSTGSGPSIHSSNFANPFQPKVTSSSNKRKPLPPKPLMQASIAMTQQSIATYKTKTTKLSSAALYAKRPSGSENNIEKKPIISVPYKEPIKPKNQTYDPKEEAIRLALIKEKVYLKSYMRIDKIQMSEMESASHAESNSSDDEGSLGNVPIEESKNPTRRGRKPSKRITRQSTRLQKASKNVKC